MREEKRAEIHAARGKNLRIHREGEAVDDVLQHDRQGHEVLMALGAQAEAPPGIRQERQGDKRGEQQGPQGAEACPDPSSRCLIRSGPRSTCTSRLAAWMAQ